MKLETMAWGTLALDLALLLGLFVYANWTAVRPDLKGTGYVLLVFSPWLLLTGAVLGISQMSGSRAGFLAGLVLAGLPYLAIVAVNVGMGISRATAPMRVRGDRFEDPRLARIAAALGKNDIARLDILLGSPVNLNVRDKDGRTLLWDAMQMVRDGRASMDAFRMLMERAGLPKPLERGCLGLPLLGELAGQDDERSVEMLRLLLDAGAEIGYYENPLGFGASLPALRMLAETGRDLNGLGITFEKEGWTALMDAADRRNWKQAVYLLERGVPAGHAAADGTTLASILRIKAEESETRHYEREDGYLSLMAAVKGSMAVR